MAYLANFLAYRDSAFITVGEAYEKGLLTERDTTWGLPIIISFPLPMSKEIAGLSMQRLMYKGKAVWREPMKHGSRLILQWRALCRLQICGAGRVRQRFMRIHLRMLRRFMVYLCGIMDRCSQNRQGDGRRRVQPWRHYDARTAYNAFVPVCGKVWHRHKGKRGISGFSAASAVSDSATDAMEWAVAEGPVVGADVNGKLCLNRKGEITRAECAVFV